MARYLQVLSFYQPEYTIYIDSPSFAFFFFSSLGMFALFHRSGSERGGRRYAVMRLEVRPM
jgi:hypothetical protein